MALVDRLLGRERTPPGVTRDEVREMIRERQDRQEARLRALDLQVGVQQPARRHR